MSNPEIRQAAFDWLSVQVEVHGDVLPWSLLQRGFEFRGERVPLLSQQGIFKPKVMELPLSIRTTAGGGPYEDLFTADDRLLYSYRGTDPRHRENRGLRRVMIEQVPLIYFHGIVPGRYLATWPVFIVGDDPERLLFTVQVDDKVLASPPWAEAGVLSELDPRSEEAAYRRRYATALVRRRLHQRSFRERVLRAYQERCAFCRLRHTELLDAAHIVADPGAHGEPIVANGIALCKLHHAAFDALFLTIRPDDLRIEVRADILTEEDGPMLLHGLQGLHGQTIRYPRNPVLRPDPDRLENRYARFLQAARVA